MTPRKIIIAGLLIAVAAISSGCSTMQDVVRVKKQALKVLRRISR